MSLPSYDVAIIGGGIVGLATAMDISVRMPGVKLVVLEKEPRVASHQTGHNSGVIHSGLYYRPGSLKAATCVAGAKLMVDFCRAHHIPYDICGKVVVATQEAELPALEVLYQRGQANGVPRLMMIGPERLREIEPHARGLKALHVPTTGLVDYTNVAGVFAKLIQQRGGEIRTSARVTCLLRRARTWVVETTSGEVAARYLVTCAGLYADRLAVWAGAPRDLQIVPFRGEYYNLIPERQSLVRGMIYPVPNPVLPFLGVHFTRSMDHGVHAGPNAVLALKREGYRKTDVHLGELLDMLSYPGFWRMAATYWQAGIMEMVRSLSKPAFVRALQRLVPEVRSSDLVPGGSGVRAQAVDPQGALLDDFNLVEGDGVMYVRNVPSPAATASIRIGQIIAEQVISALSR